MTDIMLQSLGRIAKVKVHYAVVSASTKKTKMGGLRMNIHKNDSGKKKKKMSP